WLRGRFRRQWLAGSSRRRFELIQFQLFQFKRFLWVGEIRVRLNLRLVVLGDEIDTVNSVGRARVSSLNRRGHRLLVKRVVQCLILPVTISTERQPDGAVPLLL